jgi:threonine dehydrogenase-like Zn-dependent dehydrogenase
MASSCFGPLLNLVGARWGAHAHTRQQPHASTEKLVSEKGGAPVEASEPAPLQKDSKYVYYTMCKKSLRTRSRIVIVGGGGTIGSSTALWLARRGYTNVHILDVFPIPSANSAGNDVNKVRKKCSFTITPD